MSVFTSFAGGRVSASIVGASSPTITSVNMPTAGTEYSYTLPAGCTQFVIKTRSGAPLQLAYVVTESGTNYITVPRWCFYSESGLTLPSGVTLYFQSASASQVVEVLVWT